MEFLHENAIIGLVKKELMDILVCPVCRKKLELTITKEDAGEIEAGSLYCPYDNITYPIVDGIPNLLPPEKSS